MFLANFVFLSQQNLFIFWNSGKNLCFQQTIVIFQLKSSAFSARPPTHHQFLGHWFVSEIWEGFHVYRMVKSSLSSLFSGAIHFLWMYLYNAIIFILLIQRPIKCIQRGIVAKFGKILRKKNLNYFWISYLFWQILHCISSNHSEVAWNPNLKCKEDKFPSCWVSINCHIFIAHQRYSVHIFSLIFLFQIFAP